MFSTRCVTACSLDGIESFGLNRKYLGDSFDAVKRVWADVLSGWAPLYANPRFIPSDLRSEFTAYTHIPVLSKDHVGNHAVLNDPDTGIYAPSREDQRVSVKHVSLGYIQHQLRNPFVRCVVTFDQSKHRTKKQTASDQRCAKLIWLERRGIPAFFYVSHAPFLFAFANPTDLKHASERFIQAGIPSTRFHRLGSL